MTWHTFRHEAMATYFEVAIAATERPYAAQAAAAVFHEVDRLERELSRFVESSDIGRVNRLADGESTVVGEDAFNCLAIAADAYFATGGAFDVTYRSNLGPATGPAPGELAFQLDPARHAVRSRFTQLHLDLGAIGKGYALDVGAQTLADWEVSSACLVAGGSTAVALDPPPDSSGWTIGVGDEPRVRRICVRNIAISASGTAVQGQHIIDPRTSLPAHRQSRTWAQAPTGAQSDALSTAFFVMSDTEIEAFCREHTQIGAAVTLADGTLRCFGALVRFLPGGIV